jgi:hypothetical protein
MMRKRIIPAVLGLLVPAAAVVAQEKTTVAPGTPVTIIVKPAEPASPKVSLALNGRSAHATPVRSGCTHTAGGNIDVQQPSGDTIVVTLTGVAVAAGHPTKNSVAQFNFDVNQCFAVSFDDPSVKKAKLSIEGRLIGVLRSHCKGGGTADHGPACATVSAGGVELIGLSMHPQGVNCGQNLSINVHEGPKTVPVAAGDLTLHQTFTITAQNPRGLGKAASAEFAPDALDPLWISYWEPFKGVAKKDFGFQVTIKVVADESAEPEKK